MRFIQNFKFCQSFVSWQLEKFIVNLNVKSRNFWEFD